MSTSPLNQPRICPTTPRRIRYYRSIDDVPEIPAAERDQLRAVSDLYEFRANDYYLGLIDWSDPDDPIRQLIVPRPDELNEWGQMDASNEAAVTVARGVQHKYPHTVLLLCNETCGSYCRYCFRKRLFIRQSDEINNDVSEGIRYIAGNPNVNNVLLTGGDPLQMSTDRLQHIIEQLRAIPHVRVIRLGSKMPAFNPFRILDDPKLIKLLSQHSTPRKRIYLVTHFDHPRELTDEAVEGLDMLMRAGVICLNQCPLIRGINDDPQVLAELYSELSFIGCQPYYLFQCRPTTGNAPYAVPMVEGWEIFREALRHGSGLARRPRYVMSHELGKVEIVGVTSRHIMLRFHRAKDAHFRGQILTYKRNDVAYWLDDLDPIKGSGAKKYPPSPMIDLVSDAG
jgi:lysine 2,3-aminomutase